jgi:hypothetical protein
MERQRLFFYMNLLAFDLKSKIKRNHSLLYISYIVMQVYAQRFRYI